MNHPNTSDRTQAAGLPPVVNPGLSAGALPQPKPTKRTQFHRPTDPNMRNKPNSSLAHDPNMRNEPNSRIPGVQPPPISAKRTQFQPRRTCGRPKNMKRTQFQYTKCPTAPCLCKTNPISARPCHSREGGNPESTNNEPQTTNQLCETNPICPTATDPPTQKCETNPIPAYQVSHNPIFMRNQVSPIEVGLTTGGTPAAGVLSNGVVFG